MNSLRKIAIAAGLLFIVGTVAGLLSVAPAIDSPDYLAQAAANAGQVTLCAFFQFIMSTAYLGYAILLYPVLKKHSEGLAAGFAGLKFVAGAFNIIGAVFILLILSLSHSYLSAGAQDTSQLITLGALLRTGRDLINHVAMILASSAASFLCYVVFYRAKLVPRWLSAWGFAGVLLTVSASFLVMFRAIDIVTPAYLALCVPLALQEIFLAIWLIVKGFDSSGISEKASTKH